jgi:hypothetical protein
MKQFKVPYAYLGKTPEAGTANIEADTPEQAAKILATLRPNAVIGEPWVGKLTRYRITLWGTAVVKQIRDVEAETPEEAAELAANDDRNHAWKYDTINTVDRVFVSDYYTRELLEVIEVVGD